MKSRFPGACVREAFDCGDTALNVFLRRHARKSHERGGAKTFLAINDGDGKTILGFYSLAPASIAYDRTPLLIKRGLARHEVPVFRLARLAVDRSIPGVRLRRPASPCSRSPLPSGRIRGWWCRAPH